MRRSAAGAVALALTLAVAGAAAARDKDGAFAVKGVGNETCAALLQAFKDKKPGVEAYINWLEGYLTGLNDVSPQTYDTAPWQSPVILFELTARYCDQNKDARLIAAAKAVEQLIRPFRLAQRSPPVEIKVGERSIRHYQDTLRRAQDLLIKAGLLTGKADGSWGPKTQQAFEAYQERSGLKKTGLPDQETLFKLFFEARQAAAPTEPAPVRPAARQPAPPARQGQGSQRPPASGQGQGQQPPLNLQVQ
jgi:ABC-type sugar transport system substrate-binding protein